jgi:D-beta-D-heptose 7-phosphate kinase/D-beta-D-heptose 1-phosphate adenosyltransferase
MDNIVIVTGGFDPIHSGHIALIEAASKLGRVIVGLNSDDWLKRKKGREFMSYNERYSIVSNLKQVMVTLSFNDSDNTACDVILQAKKLFPHSKIIFANGGDRTELNIPEIQKFKNDAQVEFVFAVGGDDKMNSSSWILNEWKHPAESRVWGKFLTYYDSNIAKVKRLVIDPGKSISMQYHENRSELWFVENGIGEITTIGANGVEFILKTIHLHDYHHVSLNTWHKLKNIGTEPLSIIEIQYGISCDELDIIRLNV